MKSANRPNFTYLTYVYCHFQTQNETCIETEAENDESYSVQIWWFLLPYMAAETFKCVSFINKSFREMCLSTETLTFQRPVGLGSALLTFRKVRRLTINDCTACSLPDFKPLRRLSLLKELTVNNLAAMKNPDLFFERLRFVGTKLRVLNLDFESIDSIPALTTTPKAGGEEIVESADFNREKCTQTYHELIPTPPVLTSHYQLYLLLNIGNVMHLTHLQHLSMRNVPQCWNSVADRVFAQLPNLRSIELLFHMAPEIFTFSSQLPRISKSCG